MPIWLYAGRPKFELSRRLARLGAGCGVRAKLGARKTGDSKPCSMTLGSILLPSIGKSGAILTIYMALHQAVKTIGKSTESRPPLRLIVAGLIIVFFQLKNTREIHTYG